MPVQDGPVQDGQPVATAPAAPPAAAQPAVEPEEIEERPAKNSVFGELLGPGLVYSLNYERMVTDDIGARIGFSYLSVDAAAGESSSSSTFMTFPLTASYVGLRGGSHALELGVGATLIYTSASASTLGANSSGSGLSATGTVLVGYRIQPTHGGFNFRVGLSPLIGKGLGLSDPDPESIGILPWGYISFGGTF